MKSRPTGRRALAALAAALCFGAVTSIAAAEHGGSASLPGRSAAPAAETPSDDPLLGATDTSKAGRTPSSSRS